MLSPDTSWEFWFLCNLCINDHKFEIIMPAFVAGVFYATVMNKESRQKIKTPLQQYGNALL